MDELVNVLVLETGNSNTDISKEKIKIILQTKKAFLFSDGKPWIKKGRKQFDVTMGSWDGAEVADLNAMGKWEIVLLKETAL